MLTLSCTSGGTTTYGCAGPGLLTSFCSSEETTIKGDAGTLTASVAGTCKSAMHTLICFTVEPRKLSPCLRKKVGRFYFYVNFGNCRPVFTIFNDKFIDELRRKLDLKLAHPPKSTLWKVKCASARVDLICLISGSIHRQEVLFNYLFSSWRWCHYDVIAILCLLC